MIFVRRVSGESMTPTLTAGMTIVGRSGGEYSAGDIVIAHVDSREVIKRVKRITPDGVYLTGDNPAHSTDSRHYGYVDKSAILGVMKYTLPIARPAPKLRHPHGVYAGWGAAAIIAGFAVLHLFRIDTFVPELSNALGGSQGWTAFVGASIVCAEVFALPFLLRMKLSLLAQYVSGALSVIVPLFWLLIAIWTFGTDTSTAQLGEFKALPSTWLLIVADSIWLVYAYVALWMLGYDHKPGEKQLFVNKFLASRLSKTK